MWPERVRALCALGRASRSLERGAWKCWRRSPLLPRVRRLAQTLPLGWWPWQGKEDLLHLGSFPGTHGGIHCHVFRELIRSAVSARSGIPADGPARGPPWKCPWVPACTLWACSSHLPSNTSSCLAQKT